MLGRITKETLDEYYNRDRGTGVTVASPKDEKKK